MQRCETLCNVQSYKRFIMNFPLNEMTGNFYTVKYESESVKDEIKLGNNDEIPADIVQQHKISGTFDFTKVTADELLNVFLCSTTSVLKMYQNNVLKGMLEKDIIEMAKHHQKVLVRELLDGRSSKILTDEERRKRFIAKQLASGKSKDQIKEEIMAMLDEIS